MDVDRYSESHAISPSKFVRDHKQAEEAGSGQEAMQSLDGVLQCIHNHARSSSCSDVYCNCKYLPTSEPVIIGWDKGEVGRCCREANKCVKCWDSLWAYIRQRIIHTCRTADKQEKREGRQA